MTAILSAWLLEILLETWGAFIYRRRSPLLSVILSFCALTDAAAFLLKGHVPATWIYFWGAWGQFYAKELMLVWLGCAICGMFAKEQDRIKVSISAALISLMAIVFVAVFFFGRVTLKERLLAGECVADTILLLIIFAAWVGCGMKLPSKWKWIAAGYLIMVGTDMLFTVGWFADATLRHFYPLGALAAQAVWIAGPLKNTRLHECRGNLGVKIADGDKVSLC